MIRTGSLRSLPRMRPGKAQVSVGSKAATLFVIFFEGAAGIFSFAIHYSLNGQIYVDGDTARAQWYLFMPCTLVDGNHAMWRASIDHERYRRVDGSWLFSEKRTQPSMNVPFRTGGTATVRLSCRTGSMCQSSAQLLLTHDSRACNHIEHLMTPNCHIEAWMIPGAAADGNSELCVQLRNIIRAIPVAQPPAPIDT